MASAAIKELVSRKSGVILRWMAEPEPAAEHTDKQVWVSLISEQLHPMVFWVVGSYGCDDTLIAGCSQAGTHNGGSLRAVDRGRWHGELWGPAPHKSQAE